jgi:hypothetical protein
VRILAFLLFAALLVPSAAQAEAVRVALVPIQVHAADGAAYMSEGLGDMLSARLERTGRVSVVRVRDQGAGGGLEAALEAGRKREADFVVFGSFTQFGTGASLDVQCAPVSSGPGAGTTREIFIQSGAVGEIIPQLEKVAEKISRYVATGVVAEANAAPGDSTTLRDLLRRVEALERHVQPSGPSAAASDAGGSMAATGGGAPDAGGSALP